MRRSALRSPGRSPIASRPQDEIGSPASLSNRATITLSGIGASAGVAVGAVYLLERRRTPLPRRMRVPGDIEEEVGRFDRALDEAEAQLVSMKEEVEAREGPAQALIIEAHRLMLRDPAFADEVRLLIRTTKYNAEWAVRRCTSKLRAAFRRIGDEYFRERRHDLSYVSDRVVRNLLGQAPKIETEEIPEGAILVARDLSPAEAAVLLQPDRIAGLVTDRGTKISHTAIIARSRGVPAVVGVARASTLVAPGEQLALDGERGEVVLRPDPPSLARIAQAKAQHARSEAQLAREVDLPSVTRDGAEVKLLANIEFQEEVAALERSGARGIGLFRTEFLYLGRERLPTEEEHYQVYRDLLLRMKGAPVTIRTFDIGADKLPDERLGKNEANPAMGLRALRILRRQPDLLEVQLRALLRASAHGPLRIIFPMISCVSEIRAAKATLKAMRERLEAEGNPCAPHIPLGAMIEVPAAVHLADRLAQEVDFFSIGTNDLIQYSMAIDRQNREVAYLYRPAHLAILRMIRVVVEAAAERRLPVSICGEMAGDPRYTILLMGLGIEELSMTASAIPLVRRVVRAASRGEGEELLEEAMKLDTSEEIEGYIRSWMDERFGSLLERTEQF